MPDDPRPIKGVELMSAELLLEAPSNGAELQGEEVDQDTEEASWMQRMEKDRQTERCLHV